MPVVVVDLVQPADRAVWALRVMSVERGVDLALLSPDRAECHAQGEALCEVLRHAGLDVHCRRGPSQEA